MAIVFGGGLGVKLSGYSITELAEEEELPMLLYARTVNEYPGGPLVSVFPFWSKVIWALVSEDVTVAARIDVPA
jgi:hypothetical protein